MFLKSLEIRGFKSFADKTELNFKGGVTAVVGPNGSGKSNISDAVRWVLGEQSIKSLRGGKMEDVIFAGTQFRKPVGLAQVSLTLDNSDKSLGLEYTDVTISRRLYRSGESEYYINNTHCRLKDIQELFMDTGIGKEGYSIIGQGKIDAILSGRPEERRNLLEEAAGIVKFKSRKEEAEKKLQNTDQNLTRINDIIGTYEERLEPLRIDNEKAKVFIELSEELKTKEVTVILQSIDKIQKGLVSQREELAKVEEIITEYLEDKVLLKEELEKQNGILESFEKQASEERAEYYDLKNKNQSALSEINLLEERINNLDGFINKSNLEIDELAEKISLLKSGKDNMEKDVNELKVEQNKVNTIIQDLEKSAESLEALVRDEENKSANGRNDEIEFLRKISEARNAVTIIKNNMDISQKKLEALNNSSESYMNTIKINVSTKQALEQEVIKINSIIVQYEENIKDLKRNITKLNSELTENDLNLRSLNVECNKLEANHSMLVNLEKQYEGYNKSTKNLMQHIDNGRIPEARDNSFVLGNIIEVKSELVTAVEIALGGAISDIITRNEELAKRLIKYLKDNNLGRATFLPLNILQNRPVNLNNSVLNASGFIGIASNLIKYDKIFDSAIQYVLGRTIITADMNSALSIAKMINYSYKIVTLTGEVVNPGGSLTGGSIYSKGTNIIGRKKEIDEIDEKIKKSRVEMENLNSCIEEIKKNIREKDSLILNLKDNIHSNHIEITKLEGKINSVVGDSEKLRQNIKISNDEVNLINEKIEVYKNELHKKELEIEELIKDEKENQLTIDEAEKLIKEKENELKALNESLMDYRIKKAQRDEIVLNKLSELERISKELESCSRKRQECMREIENATAGKKSSEVKIEEDKRIIEEIVNLISVYEKKFEQLELDKISVKEKMKSLNSRYEELILQIEKRENEKHRLDLSATRLDTENQALYQRLNEEMGLTYAEALKYQIKTDNTEKFKNDIISLKSRISALGVVNLGAIEEYEQTKEKYTFMSTQKEDLIKAKLELINMIDEMTGKMKEVFDENFKKLRENFNETFKELFKGGSADLILSDGDELTANIEINVQPPGKKLQNINLMSGGEKGLSAIALLFAILKMKPTPFCILDEIEAALDDANVFRYAEFLKKFSSGIQFIVITHRKGTMEASDVLYGVTMEEKGVSKIVSVDLGMQNVAADLVS